MLRNGGRCTSCQRRGPWVEAEGPQTDEGSDAGSDEMFDESADDDVGDEYELCGEYATENID